MPATFTICHPVQGVGRTLLTVQLAALAAERGLRVLVVDAAPDGAATVALSDRPGPVVATLGPVRPTATAGLWLAEPDAVAGLLAQDQARGQLMTPGALAGAVTGWRSRFDLTLIDTPAGIGPALLAAILAADALVVPQTLTREAASELAPYLGTLDTLAARAGRDPVPVAGVVLNAHGAEPGRADYWAGYCEHVAEVAGADLLGPVLPEGWPSPEAAEVLGQYLDQLTADRLTAD